MYYEGYDFIHFCSMSIPVMLTEVIVRLSYCFKRMKDGYSLKDSLPYSLNREKCPKLATMLFLSHSFATLINTGKVYFSKNPMAINYPQWLAFGKYAFQQAKWLLYEKPELRDKYVMNKLFEVPYNFSKTLLSFYKKNQQNISFLFVPPYMNDSSF